ncbi:GDCCVxC domain-containing (seleno)protein [Lysobacter cavernae]|uniref:GDCCVxC domain-containing (Seleno)protein n=1 Tax=Lysobacter cavernae TaxID=1685901 RepID=A0ABV7RP37_9GAMM
MRELQLESVLTCPHCSHSSSELMPRNACTFFHACKECGAILSPRPGDCCVFCSYGSVSCPSMQEQRSCCSAPDRPEGSGVSA